MEVKEVVPFFAVKEMRESLEFYVGGLGFEVDAQWVDEGVLRWCRLQIDGAGLMLQQFRTEGHDAREFSENKGEGVSLCFFCDDAVRYYRKVSERGVDATEPAVGNGLWVTSVVDPDGYRLDFQSRTEVAEGMKLSEVE